MMPAGETYFSVNYGVISVAKFNNKFFNAIIFIYIAKIFNFIAIIFYSFGIKSNLYYINFISLV